MQKRVENHMSGRHHGGRRRHAAPGHPKRIGIARAVALIAERSRQLARMSAGCAVVPVGKRPSRWAAQVFNGCRDDFFEARKIPSVPWKKEPALVLTLVPERCLIR